MATSTSSTQYSAPTDRQIQPSSVAEMEQAIAILSAHKDAWVTMDIPGRIALLDQIKRDMSFVEGRWVTAGMAAKEAQPDTMAAGEEWHGLTVVYRYIRFLRKALQDILQW